MGLTTSAAIDKRTTLRNPQDWFIQWADGGRTSNAGVRVSEESALGFLAVYACVRIISKSIGTLPVFVFRRIGNGKRKEPKHRLHKTIHSLPHPLITAPLFYETMTAHVLLWGNAVAMIVRRPNTGPTLVPLPPRAVEIKQLDSGEIQYKATVRNTTYILPPQDVIHIPAMGFDGVVGKSPIEIAREAIALGQAAEQFGGTFFGRGSSPSGFFKHPGKLSEEGHGVLRRDLQTAHEGLGNAHRIAILENGLEWQQVGIPPEHAQFLETRKFQVREIARLYDVPPHMIADLDDATFSNIEHQSIDFVVHTLRPWIVRWEAELNRKLLGVETEFFIEFQIEGLLRGDTAARYDGYQKAITTGWMSRNEARSLENMNPVDGLDGFLQPLNMSSADQQDPQAPSGAVRAAFMRLFVEAFGRVRHKEVKAKASAARKGAGKKAYLERFAKDHVGHIRGQLGPICQSYCEAVGLDPSIAFEFMAGYSGSYRPCEDLDTPVADIADRVFNRFLELCDERSREASLVGV